MSEASVTLMPARSPHQVYCARCTHDVVPDRVWGGFRWAKRAWYAGILMIVGLSPIIMSEITVLLPLALAFGLAAGPVHALAAQRDTCSECGAEL
jgi:hypothetical protein